MTLSEEISSQLTLDPDSVYNAAREAARRGVPRNWTSRDLAFSAGYDMENCPTWSCYDYEMVKDAFKSTIEGLYNEDVYHEVLDEAHRYTGELDSPEEEAFWAENEKILAANPRVYEDPWKDIPKIVIKSAADKLADYIESLGFYFIRKDYKLIGRCLDIYLPHEAVAFRVNTYLAANSDYNVFSSLACPMDPVPRARQKETSEAALAAGVQLYHLWTLDNSDESIDKLKPIVDKALGVYTQTVFARECKLETVAASDVRDFLDANHMHGFVPANKYYRLTYGGETVQVMTFKKVVGESSTWELSRLAIKQGTRIIGGSKKIFKHATEDLKALGCTRLVSYAYRDFTPDPNNSVYTRLGFTFDSFTVPGLSFYASRDVEMPTGHIIQRGVYSRQKFQAHKIKAAYGICTSDLPYFGIYRVFDSGNLKFTYELEN